MWSSGGEACDDIGNGAGDNVGDNIRRVNGTGQGKQQFGWQFSDDLSFEFG
jgi:hypothetical protein